MISLLSKVVKDSSIPLSLSKTDQLNLLNREGKFVIKDSVHQRPHTSRNRQINQHIYKPKTEVIDNMLNKSYDN